MAVTIVSAAAAVSVTQISFVRSLNEPLYGAAYRLRPARDARDAPVVIVAANTTSLSGMAAGGNHWAWPWPRQFWGFGADYVQNCGAKAAVIDLLFPEPSQYNGELGDDATFASTLDQMKIPVIAAQEVGSQGTPDRFAPPVKRPVLRGAVNLPDGATATEYLATVSGQPSLALETVRTLGCSVPAWGDRLFRLQYYGPHLDAKGRTSFRYVAAADLFEAMQDPEHPEKHRIDPALFKGKIVLFGATATGASDIKSAPVDPLYPGVEIHATAIENLLEWRHVRVIGGAGMMLIVLLTAILAAAGSLVPRRMWVKLLLPALVLVAMLVAVGVLFRLDTIVWLPPIAPLLAIGLSLVCSLSWSYFSEDRQSRFFLKALGQYVSPQVAAQLKAEPQKLALSTEKGEVTILFSDIVGFTEISESLDERIGPLLNFYLEEMSQPILAQNGTVDKYIGDAIMSFWNAPVAQPDHAARACRAALAMQQRLAEIQPQLAELGAPGLQARIGINTGTCAFGNMGSQSKFNYSVIGDACNFASRLEGANKIYHTRILLGETTARLVREQFTLRKVDVLRVKGKRKPVAVFELLAEGTSDKSTALRVARYESAFASYCAGDWDAAEKILLELLTAHADDGPGRELLERVVAFRRQPPPAPWDGVFVAKEK